MSFEKKLPDSRIESITFTRFLAAISIVIFHHGLLVFPFNQPSINFLFANANVGVSYFFVLSGFVMVLAYSGKGAIDPLKYYKSRFARIYPIYFVALLLSAASVVKNFWGFDFVGFILNFFMLQAWVPGKALSVNGPGWSLSVELFFYAFFPLLCNHVYRSQDIKKIGWWVMGIFIASQAILNISLNLEIVDVSHPLVHDLLYYFPLMHLNEFLVGNFAGLYFISKVKDKVSCEYSLFYMIVLLIILMLALKFPLGISMHNGLLAIVFVPMIIFISLDKSAVSQAFSSRPFVFLGEISFGIYILQMPIKSVVYKLLAGVGVWDPAAKFYIYLLVLIVVSGVSFVLLETPMRTFINGRRLGRAGEQAA